VTNGTVATVQSGTDVPSYVYTFNKDMGRSILTRTAGTAAPAGEGLSLALAPDIAMTTARLQVALALRSPVAISKTGDPIFSEQEVRAELSLQEGQLYKLGGVRRGVETVQRKGIPLLGDIPVLGYLFSNEVRLVRESELYVFLRPTWTAPRLPQSDSMQADVPGAARYIADIVRDNPNLSISPEDAALLDRYFASKE
jgi:type II secretory pathway component GspD/PulD (secretin)